MDLIHPPTGIESEQTVIAWHTSQVDDSPGEHRIQRVFTPEERRLAEQLARIDPVSVDPRILASRGVARHTGEQ